MAYSREFMIDRMLASDAAYNGRFLTGVMTTGIYCLPSCGARKPKPENVRFFLSEREAKKFGLRACLRCKPNSFQPGVDRDEPAFEKLMHKFKCDPSRFLTIEDLAVEASCGATKLNELFRRFVHLTPLQALNKARIQKSCALLLETDATAQEIGVEVGFDSPSTFYENFRRLTGLPPIEYRALKSASQFTLKLPDDYLAEASLRYIGRDELSLSERSVGDTMTLASGGATITIRLKGSAHVETDKPESGVEAHRVACRVLGLSQDSRGFESLPEASGLVRQNGLRIPQTPTVFDGLVWAVLGQQITVSFASTLRRALFEKAGTRLESGLIQPPSPTVIAEMEVSELTSLKFSRTKAEYLIGVARSVASGDLQAEWLPEMTATRTERDLLALRGLGPWSVNYAMMRSCEFMDCLPVGDTGLTSGLQRYLGLAERPNQEQTRELMQKFSPYRSLATYHLWHSWNARSNNYEV